MHSMVNLEQKSRGLPTSPGVYLMKDAKGQIIYIGKAVNLRVRVRQYFAQNDSRYQVRFLMQRLVDLDYIVTRTEDEALLLENSLIKKHKPRYNVFLKDDKTYLALRLSVKDDYPRLTTTRKIRRDGALYYGPFTHAMELHAVRDFLAAAFQLRTCSDHELCNRTRPCLEYQIKRCSAPCVGYIAKLKYNAAVDQVRAFLEGKTAEVQKGVEIKMQEAAQSENFEEAARLRDLLKALASVLESQHVTALSFDFMDVLAVMRRDDRMGVAVLMVRDAKLVEATYKSYKSLEDEESFLSSFILQYYSERAFIPSRIILPMALSDAESLERILSERAGHPVSLRLARAEENRDLMKTAEENLLSRFQKDRAGEVEIRGVLANLATKLDLKKIPERMECYDISHISGKNAVGSMVVMQEGVLSPSSYKRFRVRLKSTPDDFAMMEEVFRRRIKMNDHSFLPDLIVVDGGPGQINRVRAVCAELGYPSMEVIGIAKGQGQGVRARGEWKEKKQDEIYLAGRKNPVILKSGTPELWLLQKLRDEAHRFAIAYHRKLREKALALSWLDDIDGIGKNRKQALLKKFGSAKAVGEAGIEDLMQVTGVTKKIAEKIKICYGERDEE